MRQMEVDVESTLNSTHAHIAMLHVQDIVHATFIERENPIGGLNGLVFKWR
jgi:hypothetical protein